jgi:hypothetical protein
MTQNTVAVTVGLESEQADALAELVKRIGWSELRALAVDDADAYRMREAVGLLRRALAEQGFAPR